MPNSMVEYLAAMSSLRWGINNVPSDFQYSCLEDFVLDKGYTFDSGALLVDEYEFLFRAVDKYAGRFPSNLCMLNSQMLTMALECVRPENSSWEDISFSYFEGVAIGSASIPVHHSWVAINNKIIDLTWRTKPRGRGRLRDRIIGKIPEGYVYRGVGFTAEFIKPRIVPTKQTSSIILDWECGYPILTVPRNTDPPPPILNFA